MKQHVNGWGTIARYLIHTGRRQSDLARALRMTPAAISQIKSGVFLMNPRQLSNVVEYLEFDDEAVNEFYTSLFNARIADVNAGEPLAVAKRGFRVNAVRPQSLSGGGCTAPIASLRMLRKFEPALEPLPEFLRRNSPERSREKYDDPAHCVIRVESGEEGVGMPPGSLIHLDGEGYASPGNLVLLLLRNGRILLCEYAPEGDRVLLRPALAGGGGEVVWDRIRTSRLIFWMRPVRELVLKMTR